MSDAVGRTREAGNALLRLGCLEKNTFCLSLSETVKVLFNLQSHFEGEHAMESKVVSSVYRGKNRNYANRQENVVPVRRELNFGNDLMREDNGRGRLCHKGENYSRTHVLLALDTYAS